MTSIDMAVDKVLSLTMTKVLPENLNMFIWGVVKGVWDWFDRRVRI